MLFRSEPSPGYHGLKYVETFGKTAYAVKVRIEVLKVSTSVHAERDED